MAVVTVTRLGARSPEALEEVLRLTGEVVAQLQDAPGLLGGRLLLDGSTAWTVTAWADVAALRSFGALHAPVAAQGPRLADTLQLASWRTEDEAVPDWDEARARWPHGSGPGEQGLSADLPGSGQRQHAGA